jgi:hypothetical protein
MAKIFEKLIIGGLHEKHAVQRGNTLLLCYTFKNPVRTSLETRYFSATHLKIKFVLHWKHTTSLLHI